MKEHLIKKLEQTIRQCAEMITELKGETSPRVKMNRKLARDRHSQGLCTYCGERIAGREPQVRGAHQKCHKRIRRMVTSGEITEQQAVDRGYLLVGKVGGRKRYELSTVDN